MFLIQANGNASGGSLVGAISHRGGRAFHFLSYTQRGNGRKDHATAEAAVPRWFTGYLVDLPVVNDALDLVTAYRAGYQFAIEAARDGKIRVVRRGRVEAPTVSV